MSDTGQTARAFQQNYVWECSSANGCSEMLLLCCVGSGQSVMLTSIERPRCRRCQTRMMLARIARQLDGSEKRTFECSKCDVVETRTIVDPLKSEAVERLTLNVRRPL